ncbi:MAG: hypothetical protein OEO84_11240 [Betaproteobacteria bacterium]|nr:hypothetical protein [Betaproteobacteria bacterium]
MVALPALAQEQDVQRALIQRDQQSAEFALRLQQTQETPPPAAGDQRQLNERQRLENVGEEQVQSVEKELPLDLRAYERQRAAEERTLALPRPVVRVPEPAAPRPLPLEPLPRPGR